LSTPPAEGDRAATPSAISQPAEPPKKRPWATILLGGCAVLVFVGVMSLGCAGVTTVAALTELGLHLNALFDSISRDMDG
jgi:hypothetical protein